MLYLTRVVVIVTLSADAIPPKQCATLEVPENTPLLGYCMVCTNSTKCELGPCAKPECALVSKGCECRHEPAARDIEKGKTKELDVSAL